MNLLSRLLLAPFAGAIAVGGFYPFELWFMPLLSLSMIIFLAEGKSFSERIAIFYLYGLGFLGPLLHWSSTYVGSLPWVLLFAGFSAFYIVLALGFKGGRIHPLSFAAALTVAEGLRAVVPFGGFGWGRFGFSALEGPFQDWLRLGGVAMTTFMIALFASLMMRRNRSSLLALPLVLVSTFAVSAAIASDEVAESDKTVRIALIQGGVSQLGLSFNASPQEVFDRHFQVTEEILRNERVDLILWPENASDIDPLTNSDLRERIKSVTRASRTPMIIGAVTQGERGPENVSLHFDGGDSFESRYQKRDLVPFGEYVPLRTIAEKFSPLAGTVRDFVPGDGISVHDIGDLFFAPLICYEILDDRTTYENLEASALGVVQTNNATFGRSWQSGQQFQMTRVRAFENQITFVVAATTGDTALINRDGVATEKLTKFDPGALVVDVVPSKPTIPPVSPELMLLLALMILPATRITNKKLSSVLPQKYMRR